MDITTTILSLIVVLGLRVVDASFFTKFVLDHDTGSCTILESSTKSKFRGFELDKDLKIFTTPGADELEHTLNSSVIEAYARNSESLSTYLLEQCKRTQPQMPLSKQGPTPEIVKLVNGGDPANRIDVVLMGDGYTDNERIKFFTDMQRLTEDMFEGPTFKSYLPLLNIWAIYVASNESGIGYNGPKNTPFRLYRERGQLRVIYTGNAQYARQVCGLVGPSGCDFPSLIANDDYYGGVGGEFVISTRSTRTGTFVLRHEMGHNFIQVGDEYDNSWAYFGANSAASVNSIEWNHWASETPVRAQRSMYRLLEYPWSDLGNGTVHNFPFTSDGSYNRWQLTVSVSAAGEQDSLEFTLDGVPLPWASTGFDDREFYDWYGSQGFGAGNHTFSVRSKTSPTHPSVPRMICSITLYEFGNEADFHTEGDFVAAYPTWDDQRRVRYRPTNAGCLMRNVTYNEFCPICKEEMWLQFLAKVSLIDDIEFSPPGHPDAPRQVTLHTLKLGQLRQPGNEVDGESLSVRWYRNEQEEQGLRDQFNISAIPGAWRAEVELTTPEVRSDPLGLLKDQIQFVL